MNGPLTVQCKIQVRRRAAGCNTYGPDGPKDKAGSAGRIPRVARLMALALHLEELIRSGAIKDYAEIAKLAHVSRARVTQIMNLLLLAPDIQEAVLFLPLIERGREPLVLRQLQEIALEPDWDAQRRVWNLHQVT